MNHSVVRKTFLRDETGRISAVIDTASGTVKRIDRDPQGRIAGISEPLEAARDAWERIVKVLRAGQGSLPVTICERFPGDLEAHELRRRLSEICATDTAFMAWAHQKGLTTAEFRLERAQTPALRSISGRRN